MAGTNPAPERILPSVWQRPYSARERVQLHIQSKYDRRNIPTLWLWRLRLLGEDGAPSIDGTLWESPRTHRTYYDPIPVHIYIDWTRNDKKFRRGGTSTEGTISISYTRAEARRLGGLWLTRDDLENLAGADIETAQDCLYLPRPGDIFRFSDDHYAVQQWQVPKRYGPTAIPMLWKGTAAMIEEDVASPGFGLQDPPSPQPLIPVTPRHAWRG